jgi:hypothetical protein
MPAMPDIFDAELVCHPGDAPLLADSADFRGIRWTMSKAPRTHDVPERDVDAANRMGQHAAAPHPECMLVELFADPVGLEGMFLLLLPPCPHRSQS